MKSTSITEFRKTFHKLDEPVIVTALGRPIGTYSPISSAIDARTPTAIYKLGPSWSPEDVGKLAEAVDDELARMSSLVPPKGK